MNKLIPSLYCIKGALAFVLVLFSWRRVLDKAKYSAFESTLNSSIASYRIVVAAQFYCSCDNVGVANVKSALVVTCNIGL